MKTRGASDDEPFANPIPEPDMSTAGNAPDSWVLAFVRMNVWMERFKRLNSVGQRVMRACGFAGPSGCSTERSRSVGPCVLLDDSARACRHRRSPARRNGMTSGRSPRTSANTGRALRPGCFSARAPWMCHVNACAGCTPGRVLRTIRCGEHRAGIALEQHRACTFHRA